MKTYKLTVNQAQKVWNNKECRIVKNGTVFYVRYNENGDFIAYDWSGKEYEDIKISEELYN